MGVKAGLGAQKLRDKAEEGYVEGENSSATNILTDQSIYQVTQ